MEALLAKEGCESVQLTAHEVEEFYEGFCNNTIWPLFHYFPRYVDFHSEFWEAYVAVNRKFADKTLEVLGEGDYVWVHDYQLRSEERRVGKECRAGWWRYQLKKNMKMRRFRWTL